MTHFTQLRDHTLAAFNIKMIAISTDPGDPDPELLHNQISGIAPPCPTVFHMRIS